MFSSNIKEKKYLNETFFSNGTLLTLRMILFSWFQCGQVMILSLFHYFMKTLLSFKLEIEK